MLRWLLLGLLLYGLGTALRQGWLEVQWHRLLHDAGLTFIDPEKPIQWNELILGAPESEGADQQKAPQP
ncbi:4-hydroxythreonine-4-phosphate dehydrogenase [Synechococcus sp. BS55D]|nr:4-hydroxythreonine-4-phosphate dehydrogenase [Synechococcus sp. BS55D]